jgi:radical SAM protein with 4Fe4S-binding SPASM domain
MEKAEEIIDNMEVLTISVIENDPEGDEQYELVKRFLGTKRDRKPRMVYRFLGNVAKRDRWAKLPGLFATRVLHSPGGSHDYYKEVTIPETGICLDLLTHLAIDRYGNISLCVRFDPEGKLRLGSINEISLMEAWHGEKRKAYLEEHVAGNRQALAGCGQCEFYGVPIGQ